jgi:hypothetical protein
VKSNLSNSFAKIGSDLAGRAKRFRAATAEDPTRAVVGIVTVTGTGGRNMKVPSIARARPSVPQIADIKQSEFEHPAPALFNAMQKDLGT